MPHTCQVEWQSLCLRMRGRMRRKSASGPDRIRHQCVSCYSPSLASWCIIFYERPKGTTFYWRCGMAGLECDALAGSKREREIHRFSRSSSGLCPPRPRASKNAPLRGAIPSDALSYQTNRTSQTGRTARMTLGVYLGEIHLPACRSRRAVYRSGVQPARVGEFFYRY